jgi:hypothetical protein
LIRAAELKAVKLQAASGLLLYAASKPADHSWLPSEPKSREFVFSLNYWAERSSSWSFTSLFIIRFEFYNYRATTLLCRRYSFRLKNHRF